MTNTTTINCRICGNLDRNKEHIVTEMMYGMGEEFSYTECGKCGCLQISKIPENLSIYYPSTYYSYHFNLDIKNKIKLLLRSLIFKSKVLFNERLFDHEMYYLIDFIYKYLKPDSKVIDIGCGSGELLLQLKYLGFKSLTGADPFIDKNIEYTNGVTIQKKYLHEIHEIYDLIILFHSFEHMEEPESSMRDIHRILSPNGYAVIGIPIASSFAWKHYGVKWVQIDAPRHLHLHTIDSMQLLAMNAGLEIVDVHYDSTDFQFWGSEQYVAGIPLTDEKSYWLGRKSKCKMFTQEQINEYKVRASHLNQQKQGDRACFVLKKFVDK